MKTVLKAIVALAVLGGLAALVGRRAYLRYAEEQAAEGQEAPSEAVPVVVQTIEAGQVRRTATLTGTLRAMAEVRVMSKVSGRLEQLRLADGTPVEQGLVVDKGARLALIDHEAFQAQVEQARAALKALQAEQAKIQAGARPEELEIAQAEVRAAEAGVLAAQASAAEAEAALANAETEVQRARSLYKDQVVTKQKLDNAEAAYAMAVQRYKAAKEQVRHAQEKLQTARNSLALVRKGARQEERDAIAAKVDQARAALHQAQIHLDESSIEAPIGGVVARKNLDEGNMVAPGVSIVTLVEVRTVKVLVGVNERDVALVEKGQTRATVRTDAYPQEVFRGTVHKVSPVADERTRTVEVEIHVPNPQRRLKPGMFARVELVLEQRQGVPVVPRDAVLRHEGELYAFVVEGGKARRRPVELGIDAGEEAEVTSGLEAGEKLVVRGQRRLEDGTEVRVVEEGP
ncbi:MAG: efflux RND transporter periplasmic adaptor subunit [Candidatus Brocadiia bacterium]